MLQFLKKHPFAVEAFFRRSLVLTFAVPRDELTKYLPEFLEADTFQDKWGFIAAALVQTESLRPKGFPKLAGSDFFLTGYRIFVKYHTKNNKRLRGLFILKSETDSKWMQQLGNIFTHYKYSLIDVKQIHDGGFYSVSSVKAGMQVSITDREDENIPLPAGSPFSNWKEARRFAGPLPFTFSTVSDSEILIVEGVREDWEPRPVEVLSQNFDFIKSLEFSESKLASAFVVHKIPYYWKKGRIEKWKS